MERVIVIGCPGSGKSTFSRALHAATGLPLVHLDMLFWNADKTTVEKPLFLERLQTALNQPEWILDGNFSSTLELRMQACDTVFFLDYPLEVCLQGIKERRGRPRSDMPWIETEEDTEFTRFIKDFQTQNRPQIVELLNKYPGKNIHIFTTRKQADAFLNQL